MNRSDIKITASVSTWLKDSHGLFDYESKSLVKSTINIQSPCVLIRSANDVAISSDFMGNTIEFYKNLASIKLIDGTFYIGHFAIAPSDWIDGKKCDRSEYERIWLVVKSLKSDPKGYRLCEGDVIKLGRIKFRVKELHQKEYQDQDSKVNLQEILHDLDYIESEEETDGKAFKLPCRICLSEIYQSNNPLISPCKCNGTMKYIHLSCLRRCLKTKIVKKANENMISLAWKSLSCELCMKNYPYKIAIGEKVIDLIEVPKPPGNYIILEALNKDKVSHKGLFALSLANKTAIKLGRGNDCELRVSDISVSRFHALIKYQDGAFYLEDHQSKFGTLVQVKRPLLIDVNSHFTIQAGRSTVEVAAKRPWSFFSGCFKTYTASFDIYNIPYSQADLPLLPMNTGIPISVNDADVLLGKVGYRLEGIDKYKNHPNMLFDHCQLGINSSYEEENDQDLPSIEKVEIADENLDDLSAQDIAQEN